MAVFFCHFRTYQFAPLKLLKKLSFKGELCPFQKAQL